MLTVLAFVAALALLIAVHEYGHYRVAVACGVKVLRFSIGFGKVLVRWQSPKSGTEFVLCALPLGGYVRMLDEREAAVPPQDRHRAFNTQPLRSRFAIVAAGPSANLLLAVLLYALVSWMGVAQPRAILSPPVEGSYAQRAGLTGGELVQAAALQGGDPQEMASFDDLRWLLTRAALNSNDVVLVVSKPGEVATREVVLPLGELESAEADAQLFRTIGITSPLTRPVLGSIAEDGAANRAGLEEDDFVLSVGQVQITDGQQLRETIRNSVDKGVAVTATWRVERDGKVIELMVTPDARQEGELVVGKIGAYVGSPPETVLVSYGPLDGLWQGAVRTWDVSVLTLRMMGRMLVGDASLKNLSGPLTIADYAGKSASLGLSAYLVFLALISVSLGVLNLLPLPVLDGGHLMYYLWEGLTGKGVSDVWMERFQRGGIAVIFLMMSIALFNDLTRFFG